jgi:hypothetical protein
VNGKVNMGAVFDRLGGDTYVVLTCSLGSGHLCWVGACASALEIYYTELQSSLSDAGINIMFSFHELIVLRDKNVFEFDYLHQPS